MELLEAIAKRRSIRRFKETKIPRKQIEEIIHYGSLAPSAKNRQPWYFVVVEDKKVHRKIAEELRMSDATRSVEVTARVIDQAPILILVFNKEESDEFSHESIGAALENMLLVATEKQLGSLWIGYVKKINTEIQQLVEVTDPIIGAIALGYPEEEPIARPRKNISEICRFIEEEKK